LARHQARKILRNTPLPLFRSAKTTASHIFATFAKLSTLFLAYMIEHNTIKSETAVLVTLVNQNQPLHKAEEYLSELAFLAETLGIETKKSFYQKLDSPDTNTFVGTGKLAEIKAYVKAHQIDTIIFDDELSPRHVRNLERELECEKEGIAIFDRSTLILEIFKYRAQTAQAKTQVELARYQYLLPRLTRMWTHLSRQRGGIGQRGAGEKEIETDRRLVRDRIALLKEKLKKIEQQDQTRRKERDKIVRVALVGYTNVGKSTLMRLLTKADVFAENKLFATVDATVRKVKWEGIPFLLTDTVGFIRKLPTTLIESFKSTLQEVVEADVLVHVVDISHPAFEEHIRVVNQTLLEIKAANKPTLLVFNKIDQHKADLQIGRNYIIYPPSLEELKASYLAKDEKNTVFISAAQNENIAELRTKVLELIAKRHFQIYPNYKRPTGWGDTAEVETAD
jgi:GTP-binding protein HflX